MSADPTCSLRRHPVSPHSPLAAAGPLPSAGVHSGPLTIPAPGYSNVSAVASRNSMALCIVPLWHGGRPFMERPVYLLPGEWVCNIG